ncbi:MAG: FMN-binding protein [Eubacteriales bacterium]|nr:FMN-binding protein [Eubacteriales bacterium]
MSVKSYSENKTTAVKSIVVLVLIAVVLGGLLAILNDILYVSDTERTMRVIKNFYDGQEKQYEVVDIPEDVRTNDFGTVDTVYLIEDGNYLIKTTGNEGFHGGTVTMWFLAEIDGGEFIGFNKVKYAENAGQTLMSNFSDDYYNDYLGDDVKNGFYTTKGGSNNKMMAGATYSSNAINNAVNSAYCYIDYILTEVSNDEG